MILSAEQLFSDDQAVTATARSTNVIDIGVPGTPFGGNQLNGDIGKGAGIPILIQVTEAFNNATSVDIAIETGATDSLGTVVINKTVLLADLVQGYQFPVQVLPNEIDEQFLGVRYTVTGTAPTTGKITAGISMGNQTNVTGA
ncbi:Bbp16 family capsid cement protein [Porticoccus sp.]